LVTFGCVFFLGFFVDIGVVSLSLDFLADDCKISRLERILRRKHSQKLPSRKHSKLLPRKQQINIKERK
jgi:hypothetical protein